MNAFDVSFGIESIFFHGYLVCRQCISGSVNKYSIIFCLGVAAEEKK